jgi:hypothetical protein
VNIKRYYVVENGECVLGQQFDVIATNDRTFKRMELTSDVALSSDVDRLENRCKRLEALLIEISAEAALFGLKGMCRRIDEILEGE